MLPRLANANTADPASDLTLWITDETQRLQRAPSVPTRSTPGPSAHDTVVLDPTKKFREVLGFGAAFTDAACYTFSQLDPAAREKLFHQLFHRSEMGLSVCRTCIGSSDYSTKVYSFDEGEPDPDLTRFSIEHDRDYILPMLREARKANPDLFLFSSPWSPPGWMKANGSMLGGSMRRQYMLVLCKLLCEVLAGVRSRGRPGAGGHGAERGGH